MSEIQFIQLIEGPADSFSIMISAALGGFGVELLLLVLGIGVVVVIAIVIVVIKKKQ
ncbi:MAG: hypothetical protein RTU30_05750 [Candidatus Thorarchaeota archaeon]